MSNLNLPPVTWENGTPVSDAEIRAAVDTPDIVPFSYKGMSFAAAVKRQKAPTPAVLRYKAVAARLAAQSTLKDNAETILDLYDRVKGMDDAQAIAAIGDENVKLIRDFINQQRIEETQNAPELFPLKTDIVVPTIIGWNLPTHNHTLDTFKQDSELAEAVIPALWGWYQVFSTGSEEAEPTTPTQNTPDSASGSLQEEPKGPAPTATSPTS